MSGLYGPALPPGFKQSQERDEEEEDDDVVSSTGGNTSFEDNFLEYSRNMSYSREADHPVLYGRASWPQRDFSSEVTSSGQHRFQSSSSRNASQEMTVSSPSEDRDIGPLPPNLLKDKRTNADCFSEVSSSTSSGKAYEVMGPRPPPNFKKTQQNEDNEGKPSTSSSLNNFSYRNEESSLSINSNEATNNSTSNFVGPVFNHNLQKEKRSEEDPVSFPSLLLSSSASDNLSETFGPALPPDLKRSEDKEPLFKSNIIDSSEDLSLIGPLPSEMFTHGMKDGSIADDIEKRALHMKDKLVNKQDEAPASRESWMIELPPEVGPGLGLVSRTFRPSNSTSGCKDRSGWTDTPTDLANKQKDSSAKPAKKRNHHEDVQKISEKDKQCTKNVAEFNKTKRPESLLDMHVKQRKSTKKEDTEPKKRRPFDRELDLGVVNLSSAQRKSIIDKSHSLHKRFGQGQSHFL